MKQTKGVDSVGNSFLAGTRSDVSDRIHLASIALLASVCLSAAGPLLVENRWWKRGGGKPFVQGGTHTHTHEPLNMPPVPNASFTSIELPSNKKEKVGQGAASASSKLARCAQPI